MAKIDITEKLNFEKNPVLQIRDVEVEVNSEATVVLEILGLFAEGENAKNTIKAYELLFAEEERKKLDEMHLNFSDLLTVIKEAIQMVAGENTEGEVATRTMT